MAENKNLVWVGLIFAVLVVAGFFLLQGNSVSGAEGAELKTIPPGEVQIVTMHVEGSQYIFEPTTVKKGIPVRIEADMARMPGCSRGVMSSELGIRKTFSSSDATVTFIPAKAGTFYLSCSMNMYKGTLTVLEADGTPSTYVQKPLAGGATCGASGGGCGCGG